MTAAWEALMAHYGGNPLALSVVGETIGAVFGGDIAAFLAQDAAVFGGIRQLLDGQVERLSTLERTIGTWLAVEREPVGFAELVADLGPGVARGEVVEAVEALLRRSLLERGTRRLHPATGGAGVRHHAAGRGPRAGDPGGRAGAAGEPCAAQGRGQGLRAAQPGAPDRGATAHPVERQPRRR